MMSIRQILSLAPVIPVLTIQRIEDAVPLCRALCNGGLRVLEITMRTPVALDAVALLRKQLPSAVVGVGTITSRQDLRMAENVGAQFGVSPGLTEEIIAAAQSVNYPLLPGVMTPSEVLRARAAGFSTLKLFPAEQAGGIGMLRALGAPLPDVMFCPTGGVTRQTAANYLQLPNVLCVGGSWVAPQTLIDRGDWAGIEALAADASLLAKLAGAA
jgi:2-dehydro-3-deoxyphosphogluconate aldolase / (4S)-4-hydroxy-2-oxoglutarate aldolase